MNPKRRKRFTRVLAALAVLIGCDSTVDHIAEEVSLSSTSGFLQIESRFSDDSISPGGTGGQAGDNIEGTSDVELPAEETRSFFTAFQIDPVAEDTAGPKFVVAGDIDQDGLLDLVSAWNQSQPVQLHLQRRDPSGVISFRTITLGGTTPIAIVAGVELGQINGDGWLDVVVLVKATGQVGLCPTDPPSEISSFEGEIIVLFNPAAANLIPDGDRWTEMILQNPFVSDRWIHNQFPGIEIASVEEAQTTPELNGFTALVVADIDGREGDEIIVALNPGRCAELGQDPQLNTVDLWINPGPALAETSEAWGVPAGFSRGVPILLLADAPQVNDIAVMDIDNDGDLDVIATFTNSLSRNVRWARNPLIPHNPGGPSGVSEVIAGVVPGIDLCAGGVNDEGACPNGTIDCVGIPDGLCMAGTCAGGVANGASCTGSGDCAGIRDGFCLPGRWRYHATGWEQRPIAALDTGADVLSIGDIDGDGEDDVLVRSTNGRIVQWFRRPGALVVPPEFPPNDPVPDRFNFPWQVFTLTELPGQEPAAVALGDLTGDGRLEMVLSAEGGVFWYDGTAGDSVFDPWLANAIIQDSPPGAVAVEVTEESATDAAADEEVAGEGVGITTVDISTSINTLLIVDLDGDGRNDIIGTLDRRTGPGLSDDRLVWYRNIRTVDETP